MNQVGPYFWFRNEKRCFLSIKNTVFQATNPTTESSETPETTKEFNLCPAWGCRRKFSSHTHQGKSNISSLWIHMQNAHKGRDF